MLAASFLSGPTLTGLATLIFALAALITAIAGLRATRQTRHLVNAHATLQDEQLDLQARALTDAGIPVPERLTGQ